MKSIRLALLCLFAFSYMQVFPQQVSTTESVSTLIATHPAWILQGNVYEVNIRQYSREGSFNAFAKNLDRIKQMGVQTIWLMPINPISKLDRKGSLGSYYAVSDYTAVNPEFGKLADLKKLVNGVHERGMKIIIDWVPNHTGADNRWLGQHPDFFVKDSTGQAAMAQDWADTRQLDYKNPELQDSMIASMKFWINETGIDGFRCDVAWNVPSAFWIKCISQLRKMKTIFMLAEGDKPYLSTSGFDALYPWNMFATMKLVAKGERPATSLDSAKALIDSLYPASTIQLYFTSNHDENSWNSSDFGTFPGAVHAPFAVFTQTFGKGVPLIYGGQEEPVLRAIKFFDKDPMQFGKYQRAAFYHTLLLLRKRDEALAPDAACRKIDAGNPQAIYAYLRQKGTHKVLVILNLSNKAQVIRIKDKALWGTALNVFKGVQEKIPVNPTQLTPWGYIVYEYPSK